MTTKREPWKRAAAAALALAAAVGCSDPEAVGDTACQLPDAANLPCDDADVQRALGILGQMTIEEKAQQMSGPKITSANMFEQEDNVRLGIPGLKYLDGPRGVRWYNSDVGTTVYPVAAGRACSWNLELERRVGKEMAKEMRVLGRHILLAPTINQVMHPRWGRAQESYGEDTFLLGEMGAAFITGVQHDPKVSDPADPTQPIVNSYRVMANAKHFAANNIENTRIEVNAVLDERTLHEVYLPHFRRAVDAGVASVMASYNRVNGDYAGYSTLLLRQILKTDWAFPGFVVSDWNARGTTLGSPPAGLDIEMPFSGDDCPDIFKCDRFYGDRIPEAVRAGQLERRWVDEAVLRILHAKVKFGVIDYPRSVNPLDTQAEESQALAQKVAQQSIVLLKNGPTRQLADDVLPLSAQATTKIAVVGEYALLGNTGDHGSSDAKVGNDITLVITPYVGVRDYLGADNTPGACNGTEGTPCVLGFSSLAGNQAALAGAQAIVVVTGFIPANLVPGTGQPGVEGEWNDRPSLQLRPSDLANIDAAITYKNANPGTKVIVVLKGGGAILTSPWAANVDGLFMAWYAGMREGAALAEILFGAVNPSAKLVQSFPASETDLPPYDAMTVGDVAYDYFHGYRWLDRTGTAPAYPFGFGQSYTTFAYTNLVVETPSVAANGEVVVKVDVTNTGSRRGSEVVQAYVGYPNTDLDDRWGRAHKELKAFARVEDLDPDQTETVTLRIRARDLAYWDAAAKAMKVEAKQHALWVGPSSDENDANMKTGTFTITP